MSSLLTNIPARTALLNLTMTNKKLEMAQVRISTGLRVATAQDNAAYWSIATTMRSDNSALSTVEDALGLGSATVDVAYTALDNAVKLARDILTKLVAARQPGLDKAKIQNEISELQNQIRGVSDAAVFSGENWLSVNSGITGYNGTKEIVSSFTRISGVATIGTISIDISNLHLYDTDTTGVGILDASRGTNGAISTTGTYTVASIDISTLTDSPADVTTLESYIQGADAVVSELTTAASFLGSVKSRIDLQKTFVTSLIDSIDIGIGQLVDADMNEESTKLQALQVQAQLGIQALSIANQTSQNILALFQ